MFKKFIAFRLKNFSELFSSGNLAHLLSTRAFHPCEKTNASSVGWITPTPDTDNLFAEKADGILLCLQTEQKIMPGDVIRSRLKKAVTKQEIELGRKLVKVEKIEIKEKITAEMLITAFSKTKLNFVFVDLLNERILVENATIKAAEEVLSFLRTTLGSLPVEKFTDESNPPQLSFTRWVSVEAPKKPLLIGNSCVLRDCSESASKISGSNVVLVCDEIKNHILAGMEVIKINLSIADEVEFSVDHNLLITGVKIDKERQFQISGETNNEAEDFDAKIFLAIKTAEKIIDALIAEIGNA